MDQNKLVSIGKAASLAGVHPDTLRQWEKNGQIECVRTKGNHRRYKVADLRGAEKDNIKWDRFSELWNKYECYVLRSDEKGLNEWLYFYEDCNPDFAEARETAKSEISDDLTAIKYAMVMMIRSQMVTEYNRIVEVAAAAAADE